MFYISFFLAPSNFESLLLFVYFIRHITCGSSVMLQDQYWLQAIEREFYLFARFSGPLLLDDNHFVTFKAQIIF
jgi:hypothetical protein